MLALNSQTQFVYSYCRRISWSEAAIKKSTTKIPIFLQENRFAEFSALRFKNRVYLKELPTCKFTKK